MKKILILSCVALLMLSCTPTESVIDLSGEWKVKIDSVQYKIMLPGSLAENKVGFQPKDSVTNILTLKVCSHWAVRMHIQNILKATGMAFSVIFI